MATKHWVGGATAVAQVHTGSIDSVDGTPANNTFTVTIGGVAVSAVGDTDVNTTATNLRANLSASTHPYFAAITWSGTSGDIIGTADTPGVPFVAALTETGAGSGTVTDFAETTASAGPNDASVAANWSDGAVPVSTDTVILKDSSVNISYGLDQNAITLAELVIYQTYTGKVGLLSAQFATDVAGDTTDATAAEYRQSYWKIGSDVIRVGEHLGPGSPAGSQRIKLEQASTSASTVTVYDTNASGESQLPAVRLLCADADCDVYVRRAPGGVGLGVDAPGETPTFGDVYMQSDQASDQIYIGPGVTLTNFEQQGGSNILQSAATVTKVEVNEGTLSIDSDQLVTTLEVNGGTVFANNVPSAGAAITTLNHNGGTVDFSRSKEARTVTTYNPAADATLVYDDAVMTFTTFNTASGIRTVSWV